jgi:ATP-citrate lyase beta-subunit
MAQRGIREYDGKVMLAKYWSEYIAGGLNYPGKVVLIDAETDLDKLAKKHSWLSEGKLVVKPDQLFGKRGKHGLVKAGATLKEVKEWLKDKMGKEVTVGKVTDFLTHFIIEPFVDHKEEYYVAIKSNRDGDTIYFSKNGGIDIESVWDTVTEIHVGINEDIESIKINEFEVFLKGLFKLYRALGFAYLEINPFVVSGDNVVPLDLVARVDDTAYFECVKQWEGLSFPAPFGRVLSKEENYVKLLDSKSGASLKLTILNPEGRVWTMVAGGGASVIYADTIVDLGARDELANYGEYSGNPTTDETYEYAKTVLDLMTREKDKQGRPKFLIIGGGIANFTDVAKTFKGIIAALKNFKDKLIDTNVHIFVRRGGPNYQEGLENMKKLGDELGVPIEVYGPETHMTRIVDLALKGN